MNLHAEILHGGPGVRQDHWRSIIWELPFGFSVTAIKHNETPLYHAFMLSDKPPF